MLAHLVALPQPFSKPRRKTLALAAGFLVSGFVSARSAQGADLLPVGALDVRAASGVFSPEIGEQGDLRAAFSLQAASGVLSYEALGADAPEGHEPGSLLRDANRGSFLFAATLGRSLELSLGLHGTYEHAKPEGRDQIFDQADSAASSDGGSDSWRQDFRQSGFAGASLLLKLRLLDTDGFGLAIAPFVESGAGEQATYSLTRSVHPKAGFMTLASYGALGVGSVGLTAGARYRNPENIGQVVVRNEIFYGGNVRADLTRTLGFFVSGQGRRIMVADTAKQSAANGKLVYQPRETNEAGAGLVLTLEEMELSAFARASMPADKGFGFGDRSFGLGIATTLGNYRGVRSKNSIASDIEQDLDKAAATKAASTKNSFVGPPPPKPLQDEYPEMIGDAIDPLDAVAGSGAANDDFKNVDRIMKDNESGAKIESEDEKVARELREIREAEAKAEAERARLEEIEREERRKRAQSQAEEDEKLMQEWMQEARQEADALEGIEREDIGWTGLED